MNPKWVESENAAGRSGVASNTARFLAIRQSWFPMDCKIRSEINVGQIESRKNAGEIRFSKGDVEFRMKVRTNMLKLMKFGMPSTWYPHFWLTFVLCGKPAGLLARASLNSGQPVTGSVNHSALSVADVLGSSAAGGGPARFPYSKVKDACRWTSCKKAGDEVSFFVRVWKKHK